MLPPPLDPPEDNGEQAWAERTWSISRPTEGTVALPNGSVSSPRGSPGSRRQCQCGCFFQVSFTDFLPSVFARIREHFGITNAS